MTVVAVLADPPREGLVLPDLPETAPVSAGEAVDLYVAMLADVCRAVEESGGDLLLNYRRDEDLDVPGDDAAEEVREAAGVNDARLEPQVGSTLAARAGNTITHLLREEDANSAAVLRPTAPTVGRKDIDSAAMKLRRSPAVVGPSTAGRTYYAGFTDPIDFEGAYDPPELTALTRAAREDDVEVDFAELHPVVETGRDLHTLVALLEARRRANRLVPERTTALIEDLGLRATDSGLDRDR